MASPNELNSYLNFKQTVEALPRSSKFRTYTSSELTPIQQTLHLSQPLLDWYQTAAPESTCYIPWYGNDVDIPPPTELVDFQEGYRWLAGNRQMRFEDWRDEWIVIASVGGDPFIAVVNEPATPVLADIHGQGYWNPRQISSSLPNFIASLAIWINIMQQHKTQNTFLTQDYELHPDFCADLEHHLQNFADPYWQAFLKFTTT
jgi:hypothetical protein